LSIVIFAFAFIISSYKAKLVNVPGEVKADLLSLRFTNSPDCLAYTNPSTGRVHIGTIDLAKWTSDHLATCYYTEPEFGYRGINFLLSIPGYEDIQTNNWRNFKHYTLRRNVLVWDGSTLDATNLTIFVQEHVSRAPKAVCAEVEEVCDEQKRIDR
ncbi:hypothetical protein CL620_04580, partial [archaeon]|nr:hypothetical protein [archaeon]